MRYNIKLIKRAKSWSATYINGEMIGRDIGVLPQTSKKKLLNAIKDLEKGTGIKFIIS